MNAVLLLCLLLIGALTQKQLNLPVDPETQKRLSLALKSLGQQLQTFRTPAQNPNSLYNKVNDAALCIQDVRKQLGPMNNVVVGQGNYVKGSRNILVGNYDTIRGSNNFVFLDGFDGSANGALLIEKWKIILSKKQSIRTNPSFAIFFINQEENRKYQRYLTKNRGFNYGSNLNKNSVLLIEDNEDQMAKQVTESLAALPRLQLSSSFGSSSPVKNSAQNGVQYFGSSNIIGQAQQYDSLGGRLNSFSSQPLSYQPQQYQSSIGRPGAPLTQTQTINLQAQQYDSSNIRSNTGVSNQQVYSQPQTISMHQEVNSISRQNSNNYVSSYSTSVPLTNFGQNLSNSASNKPSPDAKNNIRVETMTANWNNPKPASFNVPNKVISTTNQQQQQNSTPLSLFSNVRAEQLAARETFNVLNAQIRSNLNSRYVRVPETYQPQYQSGFMPSYPSVENLVYQKMAPLYNQYRQYN